MLALHHVGPQHERRVNQLRVGSASHCTRLQRRSPMATGAAGGGEASRSRRRRDLHGRRPWRRCSCPGQERKSGEVREREMERGGRRNRGMREEAWPGGAGQRSSPERVPEGSEDLRRSAAGDEEVTGSRRGAPRAGAREERGEQESCGTPGGRLAVSRLPRLPSSSSTSAASGCATWTATVLADEVFVEMPKRDIGGARR